MISGQPIRGPSLALTCGVVGSVAELVEACVVFQVDETIFGAGRVGVASEIRQWAIPLKRRTLRDDCGAAFSPRTLDVSPNLAHHRGSKCLHRTHYQQAVSSRVPPPRRNPGKYHSLTSMPARPATWLLTAAHTRSYGHRLRGPERLGS